MRLALILVACGLLGGCDHLYGGVDAGGRRALAQTCHREVSDRQLVSIATRGYNRDGHGAVTTRRDCVATILFPLNCSGNCIGGDSLAEVDLRTLKLIRMVVGQ